MTDHRVDEPSADLIQRAYDADSFGELAELWQQLLTQHLQSLQTRSPAVLNWDDPETLIAQAESFLRSETSPLAADLSLPDRFRQIVARMLRSGQNLHHPRYLGHQVPASMPPGGLFDAVGSVTNQVMAIYEMGPWATAVEAALVRRLCRQVGWDDNQSAGLLTHGGSLANLTALLTARNVVFPDSWEQGPPRNAVLVAHADAHYCISRAAGVLGIGTRQVLSAAIDRFRRMDPVALDRQLHELRQQDRQVLAVSACACATPIGAFDPLPEIAAVCRRHGAWLHVDAAHGGATLFSRRHRPLLAGIDQADSVVWDAHKMLFVPALCTAVLYRNKAHRFETFRQNAPYLFDPSDPGMAEYDSGMVTVECTKRATGFGLWGLWALFGEEIFERLVDRVFELTATFYQLVQDAPDFEPLHQPECNILAFRHLPPAVQGLSDLQIDQFQRRLRSRLIRSGQFYIVQTQLDGKAALRVCLMNPQTSVEDLQQLLQSLRAHGQQALA